ncbi:MAG: hypothetical protein HKM24_08025 [Gammaproteobacteria bacterium]|nr:hypothetical protein [Gammaproteobacteria bacterium]
MPFEVADQANFNSYDPLCLDRIVNWTLNPQVELQTSSALGGFGDYGVTSTTASNTFLRSLMRD